MKVGIIIVLFNTPDFEVNRLQAEAAGLGFEDYKLYLIDNTKQNRGFGSGVNQGVKQALGAGCQLLIIANPDLSLKNLSSNDFFWVAQKFDVAGFSFRQNKKTYFGGAVDKLQPSGALLSTPRHGRYFEADFVSGSLMVIKKKVFDSIGFFDESYFMYYEDVDFACRAKKAGFKIGIDALKQYEHFEISALNSNKSALLTKSHEQFFLKYANFFQRAYRLFKGSFFLNFVSLNFSGFFAKGLNFILFIFLVRFLTPIDYGRYSLAWAYISFFSPILDFGTTSYGLAYLSHKKLKINPLISLRFFLAILVLVFILGFAQIIFWGQIELVSYIFLTSAVVLANMWSGSYLILTSIKKKVYFASLFSAIFNLITICLLIMLLLIKQDLLFLFWGVFFAYSIYALVSFFLVRRELSGIRLKIDFAGFRAIVKKSFYFVLIGFLSGIYFRQDVFLLKFFKGEYAVGVYSAGYKFLEALVLLSGSYSIASLPFVAAARQNPIEFRAKINRHIVLLFSIGAGSALVFWFFGNFFLGQMMKADYFASIKVARIVVLSLPFILLTTTFFNILYIFEKTKKVIFIYLFQVTANFVLNVFFIPKYSYMASSYATLACEILNTIISFWLIKKIVYENRG